MQSTSRQFLKFAAGGAVGTACHYTTLIVCMEIVHTPVVTGTTVGFAVGALVNYVLARKFVFNSKRAHSQALPRFLFVALVGALVNTMLVGFLFRLSLHYMLAQLVATSGVLIWNFLANKHWAFLG